MAGLSTLLFTYVIGGVTFIPLILIALFAHAYYNLPTVESPSQAPHNEDQPEKVVQDKELEEKLTKQSQEPEVAAGYFAVCREFVPGGVNGKPPERSSPGAKDTVPGDTPSVYQTMYRSLFERGKNQAPSLEPSKNAKKASNVFFVALRHGHLVLFDNSEQLEIRHVISLALHDIDVYAGGEPVPEGELWIKRNCIRLSKKPELSIDDSNPTTYHLFSDNCSEKEDFYHAILRNQERDRDDETAPPAPLPFETDDMIKLIRQLHDSQENPQSRWLNALLGRLFLALYKTSEVEQHIRTKISKKIARVAKPNFITSLKLQDVSMGDSGPSFMNPKLREMTVDGALTLEADVRYSGNFRAVIAAVARIDLGSKLKAVEVNMVLAGILKKLEGHVLFKIKPPPSNRIWLTFESAPKLDITLEPIVSSRQITYGVVLRPLINRIKEVVAETLVYPNWDDMPFTNTRGKGTRGGIWKKRDQPESFTEAEKEAAKHTEEVGDTTPARSNSMPAEVMAEDTLSIQRPQNAALSTTLDSPSVSPSPRSRNTSLAKNELPESASTPAIQQTANVERPPKAMRSNSFAAAATPIVSKGATSIEASRRRSKKGQKDAATAMKDLSSRSPEMSPVGSPVKNPNSYIDQAASSSGNSEEVANDEQQDTVEDLKHADLLSSSNLDEKTGPRLRSASATEPVSIPHSRTSGFDRAKLNQQLGAATVAATKWSLGVVNNIGNRANGTPKGGDKPSRSEPMGRGQPLPPPGQPLPKPEKNTWSSTAFNTLRRKPVNSQTFSMDSPKTSEAQTPEAQSTPERRPSPPSLKIDPAPAMKRTSTGDDLMTISAPHESAPSTPRPQTPEPDYARQIGDPAVSSPMTGT